MYFVSKVVYNHKVKTPFKIIKQEGEFDSLPANIGDNVSDIGRINGNIILDSWHACGEIQITSFFGMKDNNRLMFVANSNSYVTTEQIWKSFLALDEHRIKILACPSKEMLVFHKMLWEV